MNDKKKKTLNKLKTGRWQRQWAMTKASAKAGSKVSTKMVSNAVLQAFNKEQRTKNQQIIIAEQATAFVEELSELKGSVVKVGQMMALYGEHMLPDEIYQALRNLEEQTQALSFDIIYHELDNALAEKLEEIVIIEQPLGCASLAQVHQATIKGDDKVWCLKVLYPGVKESIHSDIKTMVGLLNFAKLVTIDGFDEWVTELDELLHDEVDYQREAAMTELFSTLVSSKAALFDGVFQVPKINHRYSGDGVLCCEFLEGVAVNSVNLANVSLARRNRLAKAFLRLFLLEVFEWKILQTDPNFGNYRVHLVSDNNDDKDTIGLIDFGAVKSMDDDFIESLQLMIIGAYQQNKEKTLAGAIKLGLMQEVFPDDVKQDFYELCLILVEPFHLSSSNPESEFLNEKGDYRWSASALPKRAAKHAARSALGKYFTVPPKEFALLSRKLLGVYSFIAALDAQFNPDNF
ncbi:MAG: hypothetical protein KAG18_03890, partial [Sinobacterium sp.]|nr:hypothetical protein [Sinobacterium sp.]